ncbi:ribonuclease H-like protein [Testicularia cyperi]|uniref:Ribonuclease n=1 Tax=Testicularia cyperi TaxID=1882483 RepID=A0A317XKL7_9BASI|nr:ribonuclease H-like protein [Testicularia cyperi]
MPKKRAAPIKTAKAEVPPSKGNGDSIGDDDHDDHAHFDSSQTLPPPPIPSEPTVPIVESYTWASQVPVECSKSVADSGSTKVPCALGVDEAGRGPVLGPLVYGIAYCPVAYQPLLKDIGFADSKALTAEKRDQLLDALISESQQLGWAVRVMSPQDISAGMLRKRPINLNAQSCQATVGLIAGVLESGVDVTEIYVDTVGDPKSYSKLLASHFPRHPHIKWTVTSKADAIYPIVGAASIAAKVTRDRCIENWKYAEATTSAPPLLSSTATPQPCSALQDRTNQTSQHEASGKDLVSKKRKASDDDAADEPEPAGTTQCTGRSVWTDLGPLGSGYPGDPNTVAYLKRTLDPVFGWPGIVRFSWATAKTMMDEKVKPPSASSAATSTGVVGTRDGKRTTRSLSRTNSFADTSSSDARAASQSNGATLPQHAIPKSRFGTPIPLPLLPSTAATAPRTYKVKWIDEPVSISKFFGSATSSSAKPKAGLAAHSASHLTTTAATVCNGTDSHSDPFQLSETQQAVNAWLAHESTWRAKQSQCTTSPIAAKLLRELGLAACGAGFV